MNIDELCDVIRQRRKRTGIEWGTSVLREVSDYMHCPLTAACAELTMLSFDADDFYKAAIELDLEVSPIMIADAADWDDRDDPDDDEMRAVRAKLIAACTGPLEQ